MTRILGNFSRSEFVIHHTRKLLGVTHTPCWLGVGRAHQNLTVCDKTGVSSQVVQGTYCYIYYSISARCLGRQFRVPGFGSWPCARLLWPTRQCTWWPTSCGPRSAVLPPLHHIIPPPLSINIRRRPSLLLYASNIRRRPSLLLYASSLRQARLTGRAEELAFAFWLVNPSSGQPRRIRQLSPARLSQASQAPAASSTHWKS